MVFVNLSCNANEAYIEMKRKILNDNAKENRKTLVKYMDEIIITKLRIIKKLENF